MLARLAPEAASVFARLEHDRLCRRITALEAALDLATVEKGTIGPRRRV
ncbi:MAG: hypothetical protein JO357_01445 [Hyphomicrobiales bacterium]|nr:hypothetical protein [Hyphomicrobiales bacterium]